MNAAIIPSHFATLLSRQLSDFFLDLETDVVPIISYHVGHIYNQFMFSTYITQINWELFNELAGTKIVFGVPMRHSTLYSLTVIYLLQEAIWTALPAF